MRSEENAPDAVGTQQLTSPSGVSVVLNGGKGEMESATIPVQWFFSESIATRNPTHVLIIEQDEREMENGEQDHWTGRRHLVEISDGVKFIELHRPGNHRLMLLVLHSEASQDERLELLSTENGGVFKRNIVWSEEDLSYPFIGTRIVEFTVPEELFARKPETWFSRLVWSWANMLYKHDPVDQCAYRRRKIGAFTWQIPAVILLYLGKGLWWTGKRFAGLVVALIMAIVQVLVLFCGFRPESPWQNIRAAAACRWNEVSNDITRGFGYRVWYEGLHDGKWVTRKMPITGIEVVGFVLLVLSIGFAVWILITAGLWWKLLLALLGGLVTAVCLLVLAFLFFMRVPITAPVLSAQRVRYDQWSESRAEERRRERRAAVEQLERLAREARMRHQRWLIDSFSTDRIPERVDLRNLPRPETRGARTVQRFYVGFWSFKAKVCRPFAK